MEKLIGLIVFAIIAGISSWVQKRQQQAQERDLRERGVGGSSPGHSPQVPPAVPPQVVNWQEEVRALLEKRAQRAPIKPIIVSLPKATQTRNVAQTNRKNPPALPRTPVIQRALNEVSEGDVHLASPLTNAQSTYAKAASLQDQVAARLQKIRSEVQSHRHGTAEKPLSEAAIVAHHFAKNPRMTRHAIIASILIGPPRALAEIESLR